MIESIITESNKQNCRKQVYVYMLNKFLQIIYVTDF